MRRLIALSTALAFAVLAAERERDIPLAQLPPEITATADQAVPGARWLRAEQETEHGGIRYELKGQAQDHRVEVEIAPDGKLIQTEIELPFKQTPQAVRDKLKLGWPGFDPEETKAVTRVGGPKGYEFEGAYGQGRRIEVFISEDAGIVDVEDEKD